MGFKAYLKLFFPEKKKGHRIVTHCIHAKPNPGISYWSSPGCVCQDMKTDRFSRSSLVIKHNYIHNEMSFARS